MKVYSYGRVSTDKQELGQQEKTVSEWLNAHNLQLDAAISDEGVGGGVLYADRNLGKVLIPQLMPGDLLIVSEISRLGRSMFDLSQLINTELKRRKVRLVIVSMGIDLDCNKMTAIDQLILSNFAFAAQLEKELLSSRTQSALDVRKELRDKEGGWMSKSGNWTTGFGRKRGTKLSDNCKRPSEYLTDSFRDKFGSDVNRRRQWLFINQMASKGETMAKIAETMNSVGELTPRGCKWSSGAVCVAMSRWGNYFMNEEQLNINKKQAL